MFLGVLRPAITPPHACTSALLLLCQRLHLCDYGAFPLTAQTLGPCLGPPCFDRQLHSLHCCVWDLHRVKVTYHIRSHDDIMWCRYLCHGIC